MRKVDDGEKNKKKVEKIGENSSHYCRCQSTACTATDCNADAPAIFSSLSDLEIV